MKIFHSNKKWSFSLLVELSIYHEMCWSPSNDQKCTPLMFYAISRICRKKNIFINSARRWIGCGLDVDSTLDRCGEKNRLCRIREARRNVNSCWNGFIARVRCSRSTGITSRNKLDGFILLQFALRLGQLAHKMMSKDEKWIELRIQKNSEKE